MVPWGDRPWLFFLFVYASALTFRTCCSWTLRVPFPPQGSMYIYKIRYSVRKYKEGLHARGKVESKRSLCLGCRVVCASLMLVRAHIVVVCSALAIRRLCKYEPQHWSLLNDSIHGKKKKYQKGKPKQEGTNVLDQASVAYWTTVGSTLITQKQCS